MAAIDLILELVEEFNEASGAHTELPPSLRCLIQDRGVSLPAGCSGATAHELFTHNPLPRTVEDELYRAVRFWESIPAAALADKTILAKNYTRPVGGIRGPT